MAHSNDKSQNRYLDKDLFHKRYFSSITGNTAGIMQPLLVEKPLKGKCSSKTAEEVDWENLLQWFAGKKKIKNKT